MKPRTLNITAGETVTRIWDLCQSPNPLNLSADYNVSGGGPLVCDVHRNSGGYQIYLLYRGGSGFFGLCSSIVIREINGQTKLQWSFPWQSEGFLRWTVATAAIAIVIWLTVTLADRINFPEKFRSGIFESLPIPVVILAISVIVLFYTAFKLVLGIWDRRRLDNVLRRTFDDITVFGTR